MLLPLFDDFLLNLKTRQYSLETVYNYERDLLTFKKFLQDIKIPFHQVNKKTTQNYTAYLTSLDRQTPIQNQKSPARLSARSINRHLSALRSYLKYLLEMEEPLPLAPDEIKLVKTPRKKPQVAELSDIIKLIESPSVLEGNEMVKLRNRAILEVLFATGLRISELVSLNRNSIDKAGRIFVVGKGKKERFVYLTPRAKRLLEQYLVARNDQSPALFIPYSGPNVNKPEKRISPNYLQERIKYYRLQLRINIPLSAHGLRHGFATYLAEQGASPAAIQHLLGHESLNTTTRYVNTSDRFAQQSHQRHHPLAR